MILAVLSAALVDYILGALWYSPLLLGPLWAQHAFPGRKLSDLRPSPLSLVLSLAGHVCVATMIYFIVHVMMKLEDPTEAVSVALCLSLVVWGSQICHTMFNNQSLVLYLISHSYDSICICSASLIIVLFA